jgi:hypothetical protein
VHNERLSGAERLVTKFSVDGVTTGRFERANADARTFPAFVKNWRHHATHRDSTWSEVRKCRFTRRALVLQTNKVKSKIVCPSRSLLGATVNGGAAVIGEVFTAVPIRR